MQAVEDLKVIIKTLAKTETLLYNLKIDRVLS